jgi:hypothetical protein
MAHPLVLAALVAALGPGGAPVPVKRAPGDPAGTVALVEHLQDKTLFTADLFCATRAGTPTREEVAKVVAKRFPRLRLVDGPPVPHQASLMVHASTVIESPPPSAEMIRYISIDLTERETRALSSAKGVVSLALSDDTGSPARAVAEMSDLLADLAKPRACFILDTSTRLAYSSRGWQQRIARMDRKTPSPPSQINKHIYQKGDLFRIVTLGMEKFGLPDIAIDRFPSAFGTRMGELCDRIAEGMARGRVRPGGWLTVEPDADGGASAKKPEVRLQVVAPEEGDADNRLVTVDFSTAPGSSLQERQNALLTAVVGAGGDEVRGATADDPELLAASTRAKKRLPGVAARFKKGLPFPQRLHVKVRFQMPAGGAEYMWIEVTGWRPDAINGVLINDANDPDGPRAGKRVTLKPAEVYDYVILGDGEILEGAETEKILEKREQKVH